MSNGIILDAAMPKCLDQYKLQHVSRHYDKEFKVYTIDCEELKLNGKIFPQQDQYIIMQSIIASDCQLQFTYENAQMLRRKLVM